MPGKKDAANDAHCSLVVYKEIMSIANQRDIALSPALYTKHITGPPKVAAAATSTSSADSVSIPEAGAQPERPSPQYLRAYTMWHHRCKPLVVMCAELTTRGEPLKASTVM
jgi:hypothetical protein